MRTKSVSGRIAAIAINLFMMLLGALCLMPFFHVLAISLSSPAAANSGLVTFWPVDLSWDAYTYMLNDVKFGKAFMVSVERVLLGVTLSCFITLITAYPLSKESQAFRARTAYVWFFVITMLFGGGLVPTYIIIRAYGLMDSIWALVLPSAVQVFNITLMLNFFRGLPKELEESSLVDGAGHWTILFRIYLPVSMPSIATIGLFTTVGHWNSWFDGLIYMNKNDNYPLQTYLQTIVTNPDTSKVTSIAQLLDVTSRTVKTAQIFIAMLPIIIVYPFLQRYFVKGLVLGSVKG